MEIMIKPKFGIHKWVFTMINERIYRMLIEKYECTKGNEELRETVTLIHSRSEYNNTTTKNIKDVFETKEELIEEHIKRLRDKLGE